MNSGAANKDNFFIFKINHDVAVTGYPTRIWRATKKYSVNNTLPTVAVSTWIQFSLAYVAAVMITHNNLSYITDIFSSQLMPAYALASVILGTTLLTSLVIKYIHTQEIKDEKLQNGDSPIDIEIRGGKSDGINEIAQNASVIEITPDLSGMVDDKKNGFSIALPTSGKQGEILENKRQENRNKVILLTVPYILSSLIVVSALAKFSFAHITGWKECTFIAAVGIITIVGVCMTLNKLRNNEVDNLYNNVKKINNIVDILLPWRKGSVVSVMENRFESKEENDPISRLEKLLDKHLTNLVNRVCCLFKNDLLDTSNVNIEKTLSGMKKDVKTLLDNLEKSIKQNVDGVEATVNEAIVQCLESIDKSVNELCNGVGNGIQEKLDKVSIQNLVNNLSRLAETIEDRVARLIIEDGGYLKTPKVSFASTRLPNAPKESKDDQLPQNGQTGSSEEHNGEPDIQQQVHWSEGVKEIWQLKKKIKALKNALEEKKNNQTQADSGISSETSSTTPNDQYQDEKNRLEEENKSLKEQEYIEKLRKENAKLKENLSPEVKERKEKINGKSSEFLYYILESIKLGEKATLRNLDNKIIIHWKDGSRTICYIERQGNLPSTKVNFVDKNIQAAFAAACVG